MSKEFYFPFYVDRWLGDVDIQAMTPLEEYAYFKMLIVSWKRDGLKNDIEYLEKIIGVKEVGSPAVQAMFYVDENDKLRNKTQEEIRSNIREIRKKNSEKGKKSAAKRKKKNSGSTAVQQRFNSGSTERQQSKDKDKDKYKKDKRPVEVGDFQEDENPKGDPTQSLNRKKRIAFNYEDGCFDGISEHDIAYYRKEYPGVDVLEVIYSLEEYIVNEAVAVISADALISSWLKKRMKQSDGLGRSVPSCNVGTQKMNERLAMMEAEEKDTNSV